MITVKNFKAEKEAYLVKDEIGWHKETTIETVMVKKVGKKYVFVENGPYERKFMEYKSDFFLECVTYGSPAILFPTEMDAKNYVEKREITKQLARMTERDASEYSLEQLRAVRMILAGDKELIYGKECTEKIKELVKEFKQQEMEDIEMTQTTYNKIAASKFKKICKVLSEAEKHLKL